MVHGTVWSGPTTKQNYHIMPRTSKTETLEDFDTETCVLVS